MTAIELVVSSSLFLAVLGLALPVVGGAQVAARRVSTMSRLHDDSRTTLLETLRRLRSARPPGVCLDPPGGPLAGCLQVATRAATLLQAAEDRVCFASVANARVDDAGGPPGTGDGGALPAPELVCIGRDATTSTISVTTWPPKAVDDCVGGGVRPASYTTPCWDLAAPGRVLPVGRVASGSGPLLSYLDTTGAPIPPPGPLVLDATTDDQVLATRCPDPPGSCLASTLARIATVRLDVRLSYRSGGRDRTYDVHVSVAPRGSRYGREQTWAAG